MAATGDGPDIIFMGAPSLWRLRAVRLLAEVTSDKSFQEKLIPFTWDVARFNSKLMGYPVLVESLLLIYN